MIAKCLLALAVFLWLSGCGAAEPSVMTGEEATASPAPNGATGSTTSVKPDEKADEAKRYCEHEVQKSTAKPLELLNKKQISACLIALRPQINANCTKGVEREIILKIIVGGDGNVIGAFPVGDGADSDEASCVAKIVRPAIFPRFTGKEQQVIEKYPFNILP